MRHGSAQESCNNADTDLSRKQAFEAAHMDPGTYQAVYGKSLKVRLDAATVRKNMQVPRSVPVKESQRGKRQRSD
jgi:hypothetical protein